MGEVGYRKPPKEHQFKPGQSGNPKGGPKGPRKARVVRSDPFDEKLTVPINGKKVKRSVAEELLRVARTVALSQNDDGLKSLLLDLGEDLARRKRRTPARKEVDDPRIQNWEPSVGVWNSNEAVRALKIGRLMWPACKTARIMFEPWIIQSALDSLGQRQLTREEQIEVLNRTRSSWQLRFPDYWEPDLRGRKRKPAAKRDSPG